MERTTVASAIKLLEEFLETLDNAYWEAARIGHKDALYDVISLVNRELSELAKLSVEDHDIAYEPVNPEFRTAADRLRRLHARVPVWLRRQKTAAQLNALLPGVSRLLER